MDQTVCGSPVGGGGARGSAEEGRAGRRREWSEVQEGRTGQRRRGEEEQPSTEDVGRAGKEEETGRSSFFSIGRLAG